MAWTDLEDSNVATVAFDVPRRNDVDQLICHLFVIQITLDLSNSMNAHRTGVLCLLGLGDQLLGNRAQRLGLRFGGDDPFGGEERCCHVRHHQPLVMSTTAKTA